MLKIDTEGGEYVIMPRMRAVLEQRRPSLLLSVHLYPFREPFARWPKVARGPMFRLRALPKQAAILRSLRFYPYRYVAAAGDWAPFRGLTVLRAFCVGRHEGLPLPHRPPAASELEEARAARGGPPARGPAWR